MTMIFTGITALYKQNIISYSPERKHIEMKFGTNTKSYVSKYKVTLQKPETFELGTIVIDEKYYYSPERLFIELNKYKLENTVKNEAKKISKKI